MSEETKAVSEAAPPVEGAVAKKKIELGKVFTTLKRHPLGLVVAIGAAAALVEIELAVGIFAGLGATALLATKSGPDARHEVVAKSKAALERARVALASRTKAQSAEAPTAPAPAEQAPAPQPPAPAA